MRRILAFDATPFGTRAASVPRVCGGHTVESSEATSSATPRESRLHLVRDRGFEALGQALGAGRSLSSLVTHLAPFCPRRGRRFHHPIRCAVSRRFRGVTRTSRVDAGLLLLPLGARRLNHGLQGCRMGPGPRVTAVARGARPVAAKLAVARWPDEVGPRLGCMHSLRAVRCKCTAARASRRFLARSRQRLAGVFRSNDALLKQRPSRRRLCRQ